MSDAETTGGRCPACGTATVPCYRPFCSRRCADLDLYNWLGGHYRVPTAERPDGPDGGAADDDEG